MKAASLVVLSAVLLAQQAPRYKGKVEKLPSAVAPQPVAYSHKKHIAQGLRCANCHKDAAQKEQAGFPPTAFCMTCHATIQAESPEIRKLAEFHSRDERVPWVRVYDVPDFVFFGHAIHLKAGEKCVTCHGPVQDRDVLGKEVSTSMVACMNCHAERKVSNDCVFCHQLSF